MACMVEQGATHHGGMRPEQPRDRVCTRAIRPQTQLDQRFKILSHLQDGSTARVFLAQDTVTGHLVALKKISLPSCDNSPEVAAEIRAQKAVHHHHNIAKIYGYEFDPSTREATLAVEYCSGGDLIENTIADVGMPARKAAVYTMQIADALAHMHAAGYVHRDIKSDNVCLDASGAAKLIDFGHALRLSDPEPHCAAGTAAYMAPELLASEIMHPEDVVELDLRSADVWSLGIMFFSMLTGRFAWERATADSEEYQNFASGHLDAEQADVWARVPVELRSLLGGMLRVGASERLTMDEVCDELWALLAQHPPRRNVH